MCACRFCLCACGRRAGAEPSPSQATEEGDATEIRGLCTVSPWSSTRIRQDRLHGCQVPVHEPEALEPSYTNPTTETLKTDPGEPKPEPFGSPSVGDMPKR